MKLQNVSFIALLLVAIIPCLIERPAGHQGDRPSFLNAKAGDKHEVSGVKLRWCPPGRFVMGSPASEPQRRADETQVEVRLTKGFWMGQYEVTQGQWRRLVGDFPRAQPPNEGDDFPVVEVSFIEAETFCQKLTAQGHQSGALPRDWKMTLPTEAQWEYACRAGTTSVFSFGDTINLQQANIRADDLPHGTPVPPGRGLNRATPAGKYPANAWGLYDMHGNIFEWCRDWYHAQLPGGTDPDLSTRLGVMNRDGTYSRVRRGGAWNDAPKYVRSAMRLRYEPERRSDHIGFRIVAVQQ
jgi:formylglycine-generating enzyme